MTLLFFLRSPAGNTDTAHTPDDSPTWDYDEAKPHKKTKEEKRAERLAAKALADAAQSAVNEQERKRRRKRKDEELLMMFMAEYEH